MAHRLPTSKAREQFADLLNEVAFKGRRVLLHRHGKNVAAMVPADDLALLEELEERLDLEAIRRSLHEKGPNIPWTKLKKQLGL
ncbi:MAG: type II toxin-antitoxin system prevent-host-death family antitoxin [Gemmatimonadales bacterium]